MKDSEEVDLVPKLSNVRLPALWWWGSSLLVAATALSMYTADLTHAIAGIDDKLGLTITEFALTVVRLALAPIGAMVITLAILIRAARNSHSDAH